MSTPVYPCGRAVTWLRSARHAMMRVWQGEEPIPVVYFRVPPDTPFLPFATQMRSQNWSDPHTNSGIGEQSPVLDGCGCPQQFGAWYNGAPPAFYLGTHFCGSPQAWEEGGVRGRDPEIITGFGGLPECCPSGLVATPRAGLTLSAFLPGPAPVPVVYRTPRPGAISIGEDPTNPGGLAVVILTAGTAGGPHVIAPPPGWTVAYADAVTDDLSVLVAYAVIPAGVYTLLWSTPPVDFPGGALVVVAGGITAVAGPPVRDLAPDMPAPGLSAGPGAALAIAYGASWLSPPLTPWSDGYTDYGTSGGAGALFDLVGIRYFRAPATIPTVQCTIDPTALPSVAIQVAVKL